LCGVEVGTIYVWRCRGLLPEVRREGKTLLLNLLDVLRTDNAMRGEVAPPEAANSRMGD
jgi:hypothetical protein